MARKNVSYRLSEPTYYRIKQMQEETGYTQTELVEMAVLALFNLDVYNRIKRHEDNAGISFDARRMALVSEATIDLDARFYASKAIDATVEDWKHGKDVIRLGSYYGV